MLSLRVISSTRRLTEASGIYLRIAQASAKDGFVNQTSMSRASIGNSVSFKEKKMSQDDSRTDCDHGSKSAIDLCHEGILQQIDGQRKRALATLSVAIDRDPQCAEPFACRARLHCQEHAFQEAIDDIDKALQVCPTDLGNHFFKAVVCVVAGRDQEALSAIDEVIVGDSSLRKPYYVRAVIHALLNNFEQAESDLRHFHRISFPSQRVDNLDRCGLLSHTLDDVKISGEEHLAPMALRAFHIMLRNAQRAKQQSSTASAGKRQRGKKS